MTDCSIFIKTYPQDFQWLKYCLRSIAKFATGFKEVVIVCDTAGKKELESWNLTQEKVFFRDKKVQQGYVDQQICKLECYDYITSKYVLFLDSDACFNTYVTPETFMKEGKPFILKTRYDDLTGSGAEVWKDVTEKAMGFEVEYEYMRRLGLMYEISTLKRMREALYDYSEYAKDIKNRAFSEFNMMGAYAERFESDKYIFHDTKNGFDASPITQNWSYGGMTTEIRLNLENLLE